MELSLFDLHCDTALEIHRNKQSLSANSLSVSIDKSSKFKRYFQTLAIWSDASLSDEMAFEQFNKIYDYLKADISTLNISDPNSIGFIFSLEDARILNNDISRLNILNDLKIKILTLTWKGASCIGGAHDTSLSLTAFGETIVKKCFELGIIVDISHSSRETSAKVFELNNKRAPIIASHSDSYSVYPHTRNLTDDEFNNILECSGLVGINLYYKHLGLDVDASESKSLNKILAHIEHYLSLGGENVICLGCDFDGATTPKCLQTISDLDKIANKMLSAGYSETIVNKLFWDNAYNFAIKNFL